MPKLTNFRLLGTDVILQDYEDGKGKIILSNDDYDYNLSYYWGSMGQGYDLKKFLLKTNDGYLINKLGDRDNEGPIDMKATMANVRSAIKKDTEWKWYFSPEDDKVLRSKLNSIQNTAYDQNDFINQMIAINLDKYYQGEDLYTNGKEYFTEMIGYISTEPWHFIVTKTPQKNVWLSSFLPKLREYLGIESEVQDV
ncbi:hypothetical protein MUK51_10785 [Sphingobacterium faecium]|uniref:hypothetical protein n=1 Tax=Sphingobacterium faecium TaxID=34087 RepID=UPI0021B4EE81|nr:hypothetical protein [Sphingobacterium faecium]UXD67716.1 hypothetical protein MUK51_10785 [Sphingobacterium faecium]